MANKKASLSHYVKFIHGPKVKSPQFKASKVSEIGGAEQCCSLSFIVFIEGPLAAEYTYCVLEIIKYKF